MNNATVNSFITILAGKLTQYDDRQNKKHFNVYRLGHYLEAVGKIREDTASYADRDDAEAMNALKRSIAKPFLVESMPPAKSTIKQIDEWLASGKLPKYPTGHKYTSGSPSNASIRSWMARHRAAHTDRRTGEVDLTSLVEDWDRANAGGAATMDPHHPAWEVATELCAPKRSRSPNSSVFSSTRHGEARDELHKMTMLLVRSGSKNPAVKAWELQNKGVSLPELEFRLSAGERLSSPKRTSKRFSNHGIGATLRRGLKKIFKR